MIVEAIENMSYDNVYFLYEGMRELQDKGVTSVGEERISLDWLLFILDREMERRNLVKEEDLSHRAKMMYRAEAWKIEAAYKAEMARLKYSYGMVTKFDVEVAEEESYSADSDYQEMKGYYTLDELGIDY